MGMSISRILGWIGHLATPVVLVTLTVLSLSPSTGSMILFPWIPFFDKFAHMGAYALLGCCMFWSMAAPTQDGRFKAVCRRNRQRAVGVWMLLMLIGLAVELVQPRFGRGAELMDLVADGLGGFIGILFAIAALAWAIRRDNRRSGP